MKRRDGRGPGEDRKGSVIVLVTLFIVFVFIPLLVATVDVGYFYSQRAELQAVADMAVLGSMGNVNFYDVDSEADIDPAAEKADIRERIWKIFEVAGITEDKLVGADRDSKLVMTFKEETMSGITNVIGVDVRGTGLVSTFFYPVVNPSKPQMEVAFRSKAYIKYKWEKSVQWLEYNGLGMYGKAGIDYAGNALAGSYDSNVIADPANHDHIPPVTKKGEFIGNPVNDNLMVGTGGDFDAKGNNVELNGDLYASGTVTDKGSTSVTGTTVEAWDEDDVPPAVDPSEIPMPQLPTANHNTDFAMVNTTVGLNAGGSVMWDGSAVQAGNKDKLVLARGGTYVLDGAKFAGSGNKGIGSILIQDDINGNAVPVDEADPDGWTTLYVKGDWHMSGQAWSGEKVRIIMVTEGSTFKDTGQADWYCDVIAPGSDVHITGQGTMFGRIMGNDIHMGGQGKFYYDEQIGAQTLPSASGKKPAVDIPPRLVEEIPDPEPAT